MKKEKIKGFHLRRNRFLFGLLSPAVIIIGIVMVFPTLYAFIMSFFNWEFGKSKKFIGFRNYIDIFTIPSINHSIRITILFTIVVTISIIILAIFFGYLLNMELKGTKFAISVLLIPWAIPPIVNGLIWKWIFNPRFGTLNNVLINLGILDNFKIWTNRPWSAFMVVSIATVYKFLPLAAFLITASLKTIPKDLYEAGEIDGISQVGKLFFITLPLIRPSLVIIAILLSVATFKSFDMVYALTMGGPGNFTAFLNFIAYSVTFSNLDFGLGAAIAFFISLLILIVCIFYFRITYREVRYE